MQERRPPISYKTESYIQHLGATELSLTFRRGWIQDFKGGFLHEDKICERKMQKASIQGDLKKLKMYTIKCISWHLAIKIDIQIFQQRWDCLKKVVEKCQYQERGRLEPVKNPLDPRLCPVSSFDRERFCKLSMWIRSVKAQFQVKVNIRMQFLVQ